MTAPAVSREWRRDPLYELDPELNDLLRAELCRQQETLELIASENFASRAVLEATGSVLTNKYAEGLPGARSYGGCDVVDKVEQLAIDRCKAVFGAEHANVQPHSGSSANLAVLFALLGRMWRRPDAPPSPLALAEPGPLGSEPSPLPGSYDVAVHNVSLPS